SAWSSGRPSAHCLPLGRTSGSRGASCGAALSVSPLRAWAVLLAVVEQEGAVCVEALGMMIQGAEGMEDPSEAGPTHCTNARQHNGGVQHVPVHDKVIRIQGCDTQKAYADCPR